MEYSIQQVAKKGSSGNYTDKQIMEGLNPKLLKNLKRIEDEEIIETNILKVEAANKTPSQEEKDKSERSGKEENFDYNFDR